MARPKIQTNTSPQQQEISAQDWAEQYLIAALGALPEKVNTAIEVTTHTGELVKKSQNIKEKALPDKEFPFLHKNPFASGRSFEKNYAILQTKTAARVLQHHKILRHRIENTQINAKLLTLLSENIQAILEAPPGPRPFIAGKGHKAREHKEHVKTKHLKALQIVVKDLAGILPKQKDSLENRINKTDSTLKKLDNDGSLGRRAKDFDQAVADYRTARIQEIDALPEKHDLSDPQAIFDLLQDMLEDDLNRLYDTWENDATITSLSAIFLNTQKAGKKTRSFMADTQSIESAQKLLESKLVDVQQDEKILCKYFTAYAQLCLRDTPLFIGRTFHEPATPEIWAEPKAAPGV